MATQFFMPVQNVLGANALTESMEAIAALGLTKALVVTDAVLNKLGMAKQIQDALQKVGIASEVYDQVQPNLTVKNVNDGLVKLKSCGADCGFTGRRLGSRLRQRDCTGGFKRRQNRRL